MTDTEQEPIARAVNGGTRPVPDPTVLTDLAIAKAVAALRDYIDGQMGIRDQRIDGIDEATKLRLSGVEAIPQQIKEAVTALERLHDEKFLSIQTQFQERDTRSERESRDNKVAVDAAFAAQKEAAAKQDEANAKAIDKSERATAETIKTNQELGVAKIDGLTKSLDEVKLAVGRIEAVKLGGTENRTTMFAVIGMVVTVALAVLTVVGFVLANAP